MADWTFGFLSMGQFVFLESVFSTGFVITNITAELFSAVDGFQVIFNFLYTEAHFWAKIAEEFHCLNMFVSQMRTERVTTLVNSSTETACVWLRVTFPFIAFRQ